MSEVNSILSKVNIVLVGTTHPGNIGATARAIKNMGITNLYLVSPKEFPHETAYYRAKAANDILDSAIIFSSLEEAIEGSSMVVGTSARNRKVPWPLKTPRESSHEIISLIKTTDSKVSVVFGREDRGLTNEELSLCSHHVFIPTDPDYSSLNISQAVQVMAYELRMTLLEHLEEGLSQEWDVPLAETQELTNLINHFDQIMKEVDFYDQENPRQLLTRVKRFFRRSGIDRMESNIFRGLFSAIQKKLKQ